MKGYNGIKRAQEHYRFVNIVANRLKGMDVFFLIMPSYSLD